MGRELAAAGRGGCHVAMCDVSAENMAETKRSCRRRDTRRIRITTHLATCPTRRRCSRSATRSSAQHETDHINLLFNNAGIGGGGSFVDRRPRASGTGPSASAGAASTTARRAFVPLLVASDDGLHRQHQQRERVLGVARARHPAHRLQRGEVRGEGLLRGAHGGLPGQRAARQGGGRDARPHRHVDRRSTRGRSTARRDTDGHERRASSRRCATRLVERGMPVGDDDRRRRSAAAMQQMARSASATTRRCPPPQAATIILDGVRDDALAHPRRRRRARARPHGARSAGARIRGGLSDVVARTRTLGSHHALSATSKPLGRIHHHVVYRLDSPGRAKYKGAALPGHTA